MTVDRGSGPRDHLWHGVISSTLTSPPASDQYDRGARWNTPAITVLRKKFGVWITRRQKQHGERWPSFFTAKCPKRLCITMGSHMQFLPYNNDEECCMQSVLFAAVIHCMHGKNCWHVEKIFSRKRLKSLSSKKHQRPSSLNPIDFWWRFKRLFTYFPSFLSEL